MEPWLLLSLQVALSAAFPFVFAGLRPAQRLTMFTIYIAALLMIAGLIGALYSLPLPGGGRIPLGGIAYGALIMSTMMMHLVSRSLETVRVTIRLVVILNVLIGVLLAITAAALRSPEVIDPFATAPALFSVPIWSAIIGGALNVTQLVLLIAVFERTKRWVTSTGLLGAIYVATFVGILALDGLLFANLVALVEPGMREVVGSGLDGLRSKLVVGMWFSVPLVAFLVLHRAHLRDHHAAPLELRAAFATPRQELTAELARREEAVERQAAAQTESLADQLTTTMESITDAIGTIDRSWRITYLNPRAEQLLGADLDEVLGRPVVELYPEGLGSGFDRAYRRAMVEGTSEVVVDWFEPSQSWIEANVYPSDDGLTVYFRDVTERVERERILQQIADREQQAAEQLRHLNQVKDSFLTAVSHELRTPLTVVQGMAATLQRLRGSSDLQLRNRIEDALADNAERLATLLGDLLDVDRLSRGLLTAQPVRFDVVTKATEIIAASPVVERVRLEAPGSLEVHADPVRCERILANLLDNAGKYAPEGPVTVRLAGFGVHGLRLEVHDEGPGIPDEELASVFDPFHRVEHDHPQPGTGVGLALVAEFAAIHGGRAWAEPNRHQGAHLIVELPGEGTTGPPADRERTG